MLASERTRYIISQLNKKGIINLKDVAKELSISEATVRRDFEKLENEGKLKRVTGGATLAEDSEGSNNVELTMRAKKMLNYDGKLRVARAASEYIQDGECIFVDGGTSAAAMAGFLEKRPVKIVTNSELFVRSMNNPVANIILVGGTYLTHYAVSVGTLTQQVLQQFHFDRVFISCTCADLEEGMAYVNELDTLAIKKIACENGDYSYLLLDSNKLNRRSFCKLNSLSSFEKVICDDNSNLVGAPDNFIIV